MSPAYTEDDTNTVKQLLQQHPDAAHQGVNTYWFRTNTIDGRSVGHYKAERLYAAATALGIPTRTRGKPRTDTITVPVQSTTPDRTATEHTKPRRVQRTKNRRSLEAVGAVPVSAALLVAAVSETRLANAVLGWDMVFAWLPAAAIEGSIIYTAYLIARHTVEGDRVTRLKLFFWALVAASASLVSYEVHREGAPWQMAATFGLMACISAWMWDCHVEWLRRESLRARGMIRPQVPPDAPIFSGTRWVMSPFETLAAWRYGIKHGISDPTQAMDSYRASRREGDTK